MQKKVQSVILFFGSFNPIHCGHINIARFILDKNLFDELWFVVSPQSPHKSFNKQLEAQQRVMLIKKCIEKEQNMRVSTIELDLPVPSYSIDTLLALKNQYPQIQFSMLLGSDNLEGFNTWKKADQIMKIVRSIYIYPRNESAKKAKLTKPFLLVQSPIYDFSSTEIRERIQKNELIQNMVPSEILEDVKMLYRIMPESLPK